jgi:hypothetical protein
MAEKWRDALTTMVSVAATMIAGPRTTVAKFS